MAKITIKINEDTGDYTYSVKTKKIGIINWEYLEDVFKNILLSEVYAQEKEIIENKFFEKNWKFKEMQTKKDAHEDFLTFVAHSVTEDTICYKIKQPIDELNKPTEYYCPTCKGTLYDIRKDGLFYYCPNCEIAHNSKYLIKKKNE